MFNCKNCSNRAYPFLSCAIVFSKEAYDYIIAAEAGCPYFTPKKEDTNKKEPETNWKAKLLDEMEDDFGLCFLRATGIQENSGRKNDDTTVLMSRIFTRGNILDITKMFFNNLQQYKIKGGIK